ncbi:MAG: methyltransferase [Lachnospiraceae bacterium]|jgi:cyclopropane fatty-acyl-phospholipid synthase-like methyltransferase|nr:methyltransferase [Lachnospiraceae bacterium]
MIQHHLNNILDFLPLKADMKILDLGTGSGYLSFPVAQKYPNVSRVMNLKKRLKLC